MNLPLFSQRLVRVSKQHMEQKIMSDISTEELSELQKLISTAYDYGMQCADRGKLRIESCIEAGKKFTEIKKRLGHGKWEGWIESTLQLSAQSVRKWMKLAAAHAQGTIDLTQAGGIRKAFQLAGIIPDSDGSKATSAEPQELYMLHAIRLCSALNRLDFATLNQVQREALKERLDMVAMLAKRLEVGA